MQQHLSFWPCFHIRNNRSAMKPLCVACVCVYFMHVLITCTCIMIPWFLSAWVKEHFMCCSVIMGGSGVIVGVQSKLLVWHQYRIYQLLMQFIIHVLYFPSLSSLLFSLLLLLLSLCLSLQVIKDKVQAAECKLKEKQQKFIVMQHTCMLVPVP